MKTLLITIEIALFSWVLLTTLYVSFYALLSPFFKQKRRKVSRKLPFIHIVVPAYKEDTVIYSTLKQLTELDYPKSLYDVTVIADHFESSTIQHISKLPVTVLDVNFQESTKSNALRFFLKARKLKGECILVIDADNVLDNQCMRELAYAYRQGHNVVQAHRTAKNTDTPHAILDAISEEMNNSLFCKAQQVLGFTSRLTGSGLLIEKELFQTCISAIYAVGGFDKDLEVKILQENETIFYQSTAVIYDEKVQQQHILQKQRTRWVSAQFHYLKKYLFLPIHALFKGNFNLFNKSLQLFLLPKVFFVASSILGIVFAFLLDTNIYVWIVMVSVYVFAHVIAIPMKCWKRESLSAIASIPKTLLTQLLWSHKLWNANKKFIHTPHNSTH